jgi:hypothetical protein
VESVNVLLGFFDSEEWSLKIADLLCHSNDSKET